MIKKCACVVQGRYRPKVFCQGQSNCDTLNLRLTTTFHFERFKLLQTCHWTCISFVVALKFYQISSLSQSLFAFHSKANQERRQPISKLNRNSRLQSKFGLFKKSCCFSFLSYSVQGGMKLVCDNRIMNWSYPQSHTKAPLTSNMVTQHVILELMWGGDVYKEEDSKKEQKQKAKNKEFGN